LLLDGRIGGRLAFQCGRPPCTRSPCAARGTDWKASVPLAIHLALHLTTLLHLLQRVLFVALQRHLPILRAFVRLYCLPVRDAARKPLERAPQRQANEENDHWVELHTVASSSFARGWGRHVTFVHADAQHESLPEHRGDLLARPARLHTIAFVSQRTRMLRNALPR
jgi:hypothetical protein